MCGQGIPGMHGVKSEVSVHGEVTDKSCSSAASGFPEALLSLPHSSCCSFSQLAALLGHFPELGRREGREQRGPSLQGGLVAGLTISPPGTLSLEPFILRTGLAEGNQGNPRSLAGIHPQSWPGEFFLLQGRDINLCSSLIPWPLKQGSQLVLGVMDGLALSS